MYLPGKFLLRLSLSLCLTPVLGSHAAAPGTPTTALTAPYQGRSLCCKDPSEFTFTPLPDHGRIEFDIDRRSPVFEFQSGLSGFSAFRLPVINEPYLLEIRSYLRGGPDPDKAKVYYPIVALLTSDLLISRRVGIEALVAENPLQERSAAPAYRISIPVDALHGKEQYLVIYTPQELVAVSKERASNVPLANAAEAAREAFLGASAEGHLSITVITANSSR